MLSRVLRADTGCRDSHLVHRVGLSLGTHCEQLLGTSIRNSRLYLCSLIDLRRSDRRQAHSSSCDEGGICLAERASLLGTFHPHCSPREELTAHRALGKPRHQPVPSLVSVHAGAHKRNLVLALMVFEFSFALRLSDIEVASVTQVALYVTSEHLNL